MGSILDAIMPLAEAKWAIKCQPKKYDSVDVDAEVKQYEAIAKSMQEAQKAAIKVKYDAKIKALPLSIPVRIAKYRLERFNSTDEETYGKENIKMSFDDILAMCNEDIDKINEELSKKTEQEQQKQAEKNSKERITKNQEKEEKRKEQNDARDEEAKQKLAKEHKDDILLRAHSIAKMAEHNVEDYEKTKKKEYEDEEAKVDSEAKISGYGQGGKDVKKFNETMRKKAKKTVDKLRKAETKVEILKKEVEQKLKLQLGAKLGL